MATKTYTLGRGKAYFRPDGQKGYTDLGNVPDMRISFDIEKKQHYSTSAGIRTVDREVLLSLGAGLKFSLDELKRENLEKFLLASSSDAEQESGVLDALEVEIGEAGLYYPLGRFDVKVESVTSADGLTAYTEGADYDTDEKAGLIHIIKGGRIAAEGAETVKVNGSYAQAAGLSALKAGVVTSIKGDLMFRGDPAAGAEIHIDGKVELMPQGDLGLITDDWSTLTFTGTFVKAADADHIFDVLTRSR